jgi:hypothetical protein
VIERPDRKDTTMGSALLAALGQSEEMSRDEAGRVYRRLLEKGAPDPTSVKQMKAAMEVLGLTLTDASQHLRLRDQAKGYQQRIADGAGLDDAAAAAGKAIEEGMAAKQKFLEQWQREHNQRLAAQSDLHHRHQGAIQALRDLKALKLQHAVALADVACCDEQDLQKPDPLNQSK